MQHVELSLTRQLEQLIDEPAQVGHATRTIEAARPSGSSSEAATRPASGCAARGPRRRRTGAHGRCAAQAAAMSSTAEASTATSSFPRMPMRASRCPPPRFSPSSQRAPACGRSEGPYVDPAAAAIRVASAPEDQRPTQGGQRVVLLGERRRDEDRGKLPRLGVRRPDPRRRAVPDDDGRDVARPDLPVATTPAPPTSPWSHRLHERVAGLVDISRRPRLLRDPISRASQLIARRSSSTMIPTTAHAMAAVNANAATSCRRNVTRAPACSRRRAPSR